MVYLARTGCVLALAITCCSDEGDPCGSCPKPFSCIEEEGSFRCGSSPGTVVSCTGTPAGQIVPFDTTNAGYTVHWVGGDCIAVTFEAEISGLFSEISAAAASWTGVTCSSLCLAGATTSELRVVAERAERRIHVRKVPPESLIEGAATELMYEDSTGRIIGAEIKIGELETGREAASLLQLFGHALGLAKPEPSSDSVMWFADTIRPADETALCALYGASPYCGE